MSADFRRVAIVNRGEPAMRVIHAIREFNLEHGTRIATIAFYTEPDRRARFVREADESFDLGPATYLDSDNRRRTSYLQFERLERALRESAADAVWCGWGFVAERPDFVELCDRLGVTFIGADAETMRRLGDKISAKELAEQLGIAVTPWGGGPAETLEAARLHAQRLGYPVVVKARAGAGGRGIRKAASEAELPLAFAAAREEAARIFDDPTVFVERWVSGARHIDVQIQADREGTVWAVGLRESSIQRRFQKLISEAPPPSLSFGQQRVLRDTAIRLCKAAGYKDAATVEFLVQPSTGQTLLMEVNTRLQVEHPVTELTTGLDLVKLELQIVRGGRLEGRPPEPGGSAIEVRLNAEDPDAGFVAAPGEIALLRLPTGPGLRVDSGVAEGDTLPAEYGSMFAKLSAHGATRDEAMGRLKRALAESAVVVAGGTTNRAFLLNLLEHDDLRQARVHVDWLDGQMTRREPGVRPLAPVALLYAAIEAYDVEFGIELERFFATAAKLRPVVRGEIGRHVEVSYAGEHYEFQVYHAGQGDYRVVVDGVRVDVQIDRVGPRERWLLAGGQRHHVLSMVQGFTHLIEVDGVQHRVSRADAGVVRAASPSVVVAVVVQAGDRVKAGDRLAVLEAMKMEMPVLAPFSGTVRQVLVMNNAQVGSGSALVHLDPSERPKKSGPRVTFEGGSPLPRTPERPASRARALFRGVRAGIEEWKRGQGTRLPAVLNGMRRAVLGFDVDASEAKRLVADYRRLTQAAPAADDDLLSAEDEILATFVDIAALYGRQAPREPGDGSEALGAEQYLLLYLRTVETRGADLPPTFLGRLQQALGRYGIETLEPTPALRERLLWVFKARQRLDVQVPMLQAVLERRLAHADALMPAPAGRIEVLDRLIAICQARFPVLTDLARDVRYRLTDQAGFDKARDAVYADIERHLDHLAQNPSAPDRPTRIAAMVECAQPLRGLVAGRIGAVPPALRTVLLEVMMRRYYRIRRLEHIRQERVEHCTAVAGEYDHEGTRVHVLTTDAAFARLDACLTSLRELVARVPASDDVVLDLYLWRPGPLGEPSATSEHVRGVLNQVTLGRPVRRIVFIVAGPGEGATAAGMHMLSFRAAEDGYVEETLYRGLHPMMAKRLQLWRLSNFRLDRLPSVEDVYLFRGVAHDNPKDERLFAIAEVRDASTVLDGGGRVVQVPQLERMLLGALTSIRREQMRRRPDERLHWNRVLLYVRPPLDLTRDELEDLARQLGERAEGLGLEKVVLRALMRPDGGEFEDTVLSVSSTPGRGVSIRFRQPTDDLIKPLSEYAQKVVRMRQRGLTYPYEVIRMLTPAAEGVQGDIPPGAFTEYDVDEQGRLAPVDRPYGHNRANVVVGVLSNRTVKCPEGMQRVVILGDPSKEVGSLAQAECERIMGALDLAERLNVPLEWFALSAGAKISMQSGTENMDWIAKVLRRIIEFTQAGREINIVVIGINVGAQPYWNAEATMLMHTKGILVMTPEGAMVLTGKTALDYSGSVSAEDNLGIGGYDHIMGPNGQAQYWAKDIGEACKILLRHYDHTYVAPGERFPRRAASSDPASRNICLFPHDEVNLDGFRLVGDIFSDETNPGRKKPFDVRKVMRAVSDQDHEPLERWSGMRDAEVAVSWDAHIGGYPVAMIGLESRPVPRAGLVPPDGPEQWTSGTLFPMASKKVARTVNAASRVRPLVILANLSGFDGSPESMRRRQLEFGAEIGRAVVNFEGPIVFCVISRYHGGAFVVFSKALNENMEVVALEGSFASVIGGAPAAAVVFAREVDGRCRKDPRVVGLEKELQAAPDADKPALRLRLAEMLKQVRSEKLGEVADEFDRVHTVHRALQVGSLDRIIRASELRPYLIDAIERGMGKELQRLARLGVTV